MDTLRLYIGMPIIRLLMCAWFVYPPPLLLSSPCLQISGIVIDNFKTTLPAEKGLSSSAAVCVLTARAFSLLYDLKLTIRGEMEYAYQGEILTPSQCGRMDQGCAYGSRPILMTYDGEHLDVEEMSVPPGASLHYVLVDLQGEKSTTVILEGLQSGYPEAKTETDKGYVYQTYT
jgi:galactokinase